MGEKMAEEQFLHLWIYWTMADYTVKTFGMQLCMYAVGLKIQFVSSH